jgi:hypothetical protein
MLEPNQNLKARLLTRRNLLRLGKWGGTAALVFSAYVVYMIWGHLPEVWAYDRAYSILRIGESIERAEELLGTPAEVQEMANGLQRLVYRVSPLAVRGTRSEVIVCTRWLVDFDAAGNVIRLTRDDGPC